MSGDPLYDHLENMKQPRVFRDAYHELDEMKQVLSWASENVWVVQRFPDDGWIVHGMTRLEAKPTLYEALHTAWEKRDE